MHIKKLFHALIIFFTGIAVLFFAYHFLSPDIAPRTLTATETRVPIYDNALQHGWADWSWGTVTDFASTEQTQSPPSAIKFTSSAWGGLYLHTDSSLQITKDSRIEFFLRTTTPDTNVTVIFHDHTNRPYPRTIRIEDYGGKPIEHSWKHYSLPLIEVVTNETTLSGITLQNTTNATQIMYLDTLSVVNPVALKQAAQRYVYADSVAPDWMNWSWDSTVNFDDAQQMYEGGKSIAFAPEKGWAGLYLHTDNSVIGSDYSTLTFAAKATKPGQKFAVVLFGEFNQQLSSPVPLTQYGTLPSDSWKIYTIPLSDLGGMNKKITGIGIFNLTSVSQPTLWIDAISFTNNITSAPATNVQTPNFSPSPTPIKSEQSVTSPTPSAISKQLLASDQSNPFSNAQFYIKPDNNAKKTADEYRAAGRTTDADHMMKIANNATALWAVGGDPYGLVNDYVTRATNTNTLPVIVSYNIPGRDCGLYSQGGTTYENYKLWITKIADAIGERKAVVVLEPDAMGLDCLQNETTYSLMRHAVQTLEAKTNTAVYVDASTWVDPETMSKRLTTIDIQKAQGFAINISGYNRTEAMIEYGNNVASKIGGKHFIVDTSRNGNGPYDPSQHEPWCNPPDRALGNRPTSSTGHEKVDAFLWLKVPGESDGTCRGGPTAGHWWPEYALGLAQKANY